MALCPRKRTVRLLGVALVAVTSVAGACSPPVTKAPNPNAGVVEVRRMLQQQAVRLAAGDIEGYLGPTRSTARTIDEAIAAGKKAVPIRTIDIAFNPARGSDTFSAVFRNAPVEYQYRYVDLPPDNIFSFILRSTIEKQKDGSWIITDAVPDPTTPLPPWATGPVDLSRSEHFVAMHRPGTPRVSDAMQLAEERRALLAPELVPLVPDGIHLMLLAANNAELREFSGANVGEGVLALARAAPIGAGAGLSRNRQMVVDLSATFCDCPASEDGKITVLDPGQVFQHELGHLFLLRYEAESMPAWTAEAAAMFLAGERRIEDWRAIGHLFADMQFEQLQTPEAMGGAEYAYANAAVLYLVEKFGVKQWWDYYDNFSRDPRGKATEIYARSYHFEMRDLDAQTREWIAKQVAA